jgi:hypothetical protein
LKKALTVIAIAAVGTSLVTAQSGYNRGNDNNKRDNYYQGQQGIYFQGRMLTYTYDEKPYANGGSVMIAARRTADMIGASFDRDYSGREIRMRWHNNSIRYNLGDRSFDINGRRETLTTPGENRRDVLFLPAEIFRRLTDGAIDPRGWGDRYDTDGNWRQQPDYGRPGQYRPDEIYWDSRPLSFSYDEQPYMRNGVLMVPFRATADKIGARTERSSDGLRVWIYYNGDRIEYDKGHTWYRLNDQQRTLKTISEDRRDVLFVPVTLFQELTRGRLRIGY